MAVHYFWPWPVSGPLCYLSLDPEAVTRQSRCHFCVYYKCLALVESCNSHARLRVSGRMGMLLRRWPSYFGFLSISGMMVGAMPSMFQGEWYRPDALAVDWSSFTFDWPHLCCESTSLVFMTTDPTSFGEFHQLSFQTGPTDYEFHQSWCWTISSTVMRFFSYYLWL